jgi:hypothetical protein
MLHTIFNIIGIKRTVTVFDLICIYIEYPYSLYLLVLTVSDIFSYFGLGKYVSYFPLMIKY